MTTPTPENAPPGTEIVRVRDGNNPFFGGAPLQNGAIYTIRAHVKSACGLPGLLLNEVINGLQKESGQEWCYAPACFRLLEIHRDLTSLLETKKAPETSDA